MVILDRYDKKTVKLILGSVSFLIILLSVLGYFSYEKYISKKKLEEKKQSLILKESRDRNNYESFILNIENGSAIDEFKELYTSLLIDKNNFKKDGWDLTESSCSGFSCNILFDRAKNSTFKYKEILKDEQIYRPTFNENELRFTGVNYSFASNDNLHKKKR
ncbi:hypothetical protein [Photobacterium kishitanii]|uniref:hypothetical protein n=1 Tax=Photobacterium kishitanii TaxID=318456 RepID=UPI0005D41D7B|nr:hypothetical protein [Photobacterium kishitanii]KJG65265.1 hypothetical protein UA40_12525 [Photobacterium kishitanii]